MKYIGIDHHKQYSVVAVMDEKGTLLNKGRFPMKRTCIREYLTKVKGDEPAKAVLEASYGWEFLYDVVQDIIDEVILAHPLKTRAIAEARIKHDLLDATTLAHLLRADLIPPAYAPPQAIRSIRNLLRFRFTYTYLSVEVKNRTSALLDRHHLEDPEFLALSDRFGKTGRAFLKTLPLPQYETFILERSLELLDLCKERIHEIDALLKAILAEDPVVQLLDTIPGLGPFFASLIRYELGDITRFPSAKKLCAYIGIVPSLSSSGGKSYTGRITRQGNRLLRWAFTEAVFPAIKKDATLRQFYERIAAVHGVKGAKVATARKLVSIVYRVWMDQRPYQDRVDAVALFRH